MGYFTDCRPDQRFSSAKRTIGLDGVSPVAVVIDWDQRRTIQVGTSSRDVGDDDDFFFDALARHIDQLPTDATEIKVGPDGHLLSTSCDPDLDYTEIPNYLPRSAYSPDLPTVRRSDLTELDRLGVQTDLVTYRLGSETRSVCFKYYMTRTNLSVVWHEAHCIANIPKHPNIVSFGSLVVDSVDGGEDKVLGFTTKFVPGGTVLDNTSRVFKLKYLKQLIEAVDFLNLRLGIVHGDICPWNLLIDEETDDLKVFDFNFAAKLGWEGDPNYSVAFGYEENRNDVKYTIFTLYEVITRDLHFREELYPEEQHVSEVVDLEEWEQHEDVHLDAPVAEYRAVLDEWVARRATIDQEMTHYTQAPDSIDWPDVPPLPEVEYFGEMMRVPSRLRQELVSTGEKFVQWQRPGSHEFPLPAGKRLLATGEVVDDEDGA